MIVNMMREFLKLEAASGLLVMAGAVLAMIAENSPAQSFYGQLLSVPVEIRFGQFEIAKPLLLWVNDGLMAIFFLLVGLEIKREVLEGELSEPSRIILPAIAAVGGMAIPALIYVYFNWGDPDALNGWAIPAATDIAFALGVLSLLGNRVPESLKLFLLTLAILDDMGAIIIIAIFYTSDLSVSALLVSIIAIITLGILNRRRVTSLTPYIIIGVIFWAAVLKSGVHATLAGVVLALFIPLRVKNEDGNSPLRILEHDLHTTVAFLILPLFAFMNAGISLEGLSFNSLLDPIPLGIAAGLFAGKQLGIFGFVWTAVKLRLVKLPQEMGWLELYGLAALCGIGFTMSFFISGLAFEQDGIDVILNDRIGIFMGSVLSVIVGYLVLRIALARSKS
ncbi:MAG: Na+/H+ antiporter NhaA [Gammaproteobacteria bacterium]